MGYGNNIVECLLKKSKRKAPHIKLFSEMNYETLKKLEKYSNFRTHMIIK